MSSFIQLGLFLSLFSSVVFSGEVFEAFPDKINASDKYVFYSHGFIVEGTNATPSPLLSIFKSAVWLDQYI